MRLQERLHQRTDQPKNEQDYENENRPGEAFIVTFRLYGPGKSLYDKSWKLGDFEKVE